MMSLTVFFIFKEFQNKYLYIPNALLIIFYNSVWFRNVVTLIFFYLNFSYIVLVSNFIVELFYFWKNNTSSLIIIVFLL